MVSYEYIEQPYRMRLLEMAIQLSERTDNGKSISDNYHDLLKLITGEI